MLLERTELLINEGQEVDFAAAMHSLNGFREQAWLYSQYRQSFVDNDRGLADLR